MSGWDDPMGRIRELERELSRRRAADNAPIVGIVVDDEAGIERACQAIVEGNTQYDWRPGTNTSLPDHLRDDLCAWVRALRAWDRGVDQ